MLKKLVLILLMAAIVVTGCTPDTIPSQQEEGAEDRIEDHRQEGANSDTGDAGQAGAEQDKPPVKDDEGKKEQKVVLEEIDNQTNNPPPDQQKEDQGEKSLLISQEETAMMFISAWKQKDLEKMDMLTLKPLKDFFFNSEIFFASYDYLQRGDLAGFIRDGIESLEVYDPNALENVQFISKGEMNDHITVRLGNAFDISFQFTPGEEMWKIKMIDSWPVQVREEVPGDWGSLNKTLVKQVKDINRDNLAEVLTMGYWGEWEGMGPEPSSALGIYTFNGESFDNLFFKGIEDRINNDRVLIAQGGMGNITGSHSLELMLVEKSAAELLNPDTFQRAEYFLTLYALDDGQLVTIEEVDWKSLINDDISLEQAEGSNVLEPRWLEIGGVASLKDTDRENVVIKVGLYKQGEYLGPTPDREAIFVLCREKGEWQVEWKHIGLPRETHEIIIDQPGQGDRLNRLYYQDILDGDEKGALYEVYYNGQEWVETPLSYGLHVKSIADMDQDGINEFLVWDGDRLKIISREGKKLWETERLKGTKEIPFAWMGSFSGEQRVVAALHRGAPVYWKSHVYQWKGKDYSIQFTWESQELGTGGITALEVRDINNDGLPEIMVNFYNDYLSPGQFFKVFFEEHNTQNYQEE